MKAEIGLKMSEMCSMAQIFLYFMYEFDQYLCDRSAFFCVCAYNLNFLRVQSEPYWFALGQRRVEKGWLMRWYLLLPHMLTLFLTPQTQTARQKITVFLQLLIVSF